MEQINRELLSNIKINDCVYRYTNNKSPLYKAVCKTTQSLYLTAEGGTGKTTALKTFWYDFLLGNHNIPCMYIECKLLNESPTAIMDYISFNYKMNCENIPDSESPILLLDGANELKPYLSKEDSNDVCKFVKECNCLIKKGLRLIITSRNKNVTHYFDTDNTKGNEFENIQFGTIMELSDKQLNLAINEKGIKKGTPLYKLLKNNMMLSIYTNLENYVKVDEILQDNINDMKLLDLYFNICYKTRFIKNKLTDFSSKTDKEMYDIICAYEKKDTESEIFKKYKPYVLEIRKLLSEDYTKLYNAYVENAFDLNFEYVNPVNLNSFEDNNKFSNYYAYDSFQMVEFKDGTYYWINERFFEYFSAVKLSKVIQEYKNRSTIKTIDAAYLSSILETKIGHNINSNSSSSFENWDSKLKDSYYSTPNNLYNLIKNMLKYSRLTEKEIDELLANCEDENIKYILSYSYVLLTKRINKHINKIPICCFEYSVDITTIFIHKNVTEIDNYAFHDCTNLKRIIFESGIHLQKIGNYAFCYCTNLKNIEIPESVKSIGDYAFSSCCNLTCILVFEMNLLYDKRDNCNAITEAKTNKLISGCQSTTIPNSVTSIGEYAFYYCRSLTSIEIPYGVTSIGDFTFYNCINLTNIEIPNSVTSIGEYAFYYCKSLTSIEIPYGVTSIGDFTFYECSSLTNVEIPNSVTSIGEYAFYYCRSLTSIEIPNSVTNIKNNAFLGCESLYKVINKSNLNLTIGSTYNGYLAHYAKLVTNKDESITYKNDGNEYIETEDKFLFSKNKNTYKLIAYIGNEELVTLPTDINGNSYQLFGIRGVEKVIIPNAFTTIESYAFEECSSLASIKIPNSVTSIGDGAFSGCTSLTSIEIPNSVKSIGDYAFSNCSNLIQVHISDLESWCKISFSNSYSNPLYLAYNLYLNDKLLTNVVIPDSITNIGNYTFFNCSSLTSIKIPNSVTNIGYCAFGRCSSLTSIEIPNSVTSIGGSAFNGCYSLTSIEIPSSVTSIEQYAFYECSNLTSIEIPKSVTSIGWYAFYGCSSLASIEIPNSVTSIESDAFHGCSSLASIEIPNSVTSIGELAFYGCNRLISIKISKSIKEIEYDAFKDCSNLTTLEILNENSTVLDPIFYCCHNIKKIICTELVFKKIKSLYPDINVDFEII